MFLRPGRNSILMFPNKSVGCFYNLMHRASMPIDMNTVFTIH